MDQDFNNKIVLVIRKDLESWQVANTVAHISAYLGNKLEENFGTGDNFITLDKKTHPRNSQYPIIIKRANSSEQLHNLVGKVRGSNFLYHGFIREMLDHTSDIDLQAALEKKNDTEVEYLGIGVFGKNEEVDRLTKKFGLWN